jgi:hypothetical protein
VEADFFLAMITLRVPQKARPPFFYAEPTSFTSMRDTRGSQSDDDFDDILELRKPPFPQFETV